MWRSNNFSLSDNQSRTGTWEAANGVQIGNAVIMRFSMVVTLLPFAVLCGSVSAQGNSESNGAATSETNAEATAEASAETSNEERTSNRNKKTEREMSFNRKLDRDWETFKRVFGKTYTGYDERYRRRLFEKCVNENFHHNLKADLGFSTYRRGLNAYSDLTKEEIEKYRTGFNPDYPPSNSSSTWLGFANIPTPKKMDWRDEGLVTPIKDQGLCGSCWSFSAIASLEGQHRKKTKDLISLSEQNLIDCSDEGNRGCVTGWMTAAFDYIKSNGGVDTEKSYPYDGEVGRCRFSKYHIGAKVTGYVELPEGDENELKKAVASIGPITAGIDARNDGFQNYKSGIYEEPNCSSSQLDHAVVVVGYGTEDGTDYWIVKNSWGKSWGMNGYMRLARNKNNQCGIASRASYPLV